MQEEGKGERKEQYNCHYLLLLLLFTLLMTPLLHTLHIIHQTLPLHLLSLSLEIIFKV